MTGDTSHSPEDLIWDDHIEDETSDELVCLLKERLHIQEINVCWRSHCSWPGPYESRKETKRKRNEREKERENKADSLEMDGRTRRRTETLCLIRDKRILQNTNLLESALMTVLHLQAHAANGMEGCKEVNAATLSVAAKHLAVLVYRDINQVLCCFSTIYLDRRPYMSCKTFLFLFSVELVLHYACC